MKRFDFIWALLLVAAIAGFSAYSPSKAFDEALTIENEDGTTTTTTFAGTNQQKVYALDTISAATTTYVNVPWTLASPYQYQYFFKMRKIGVTPNVRIRLEERNATNSSIWSAIDSVSMSGADSTKLHFRLRGTNAYGSNHRIAFVKTGTGAVARNIEFVVKATN